MKPSTRGKYLYRIARLLQERSRELAVLESIDNGKPIRESARRRPSPRRRALLLLRGLGRQARSPGFGPNPASARCRRSGDPVELPVAHAGVEDRRHARVRQHRRAQARRDHAAQRAALRRDPAAGRAAPGRREHPHRRAGETGRLLVTHKGVDKVAFTGSTEVGKEIARSVAGTRKKVTLKLGGKAANVVFDDAALDEAVEGIVEGIFFNQGHVCCGVRGSSYRSRSPRT